MNSVVQDLFANKPIRKFLKKTRYAWALVLVYPLARYMNPALLPVAIGVSMVGQLIQGWCFGSLVKNWELSIRGPYVLVRNPMYLGRFFLILGFICLLGSLPAVAVYTILYYPYMLFRVKREERRLRRTFGEEFERYCRDVGRFLPSPRRLGNPAVRFFDLTMFLDNNGHWNILLTLVAYVAVYSIHLLL